MNSTGVDICQFYKEASDHAFRGGLRSLPRCNVVDLPSPVPANLFMSNYSLTWQEGLGGTSGTLASGGDTNWCNHCSVSAGTLAEPRHGDLWGHARADESDNPLTAVPLR